MDTSDDALGLGGGDDIPSRPAENVRQTAKPVDRGSEAARRERERRRAAAGAQLEPPKLGTPGLLGAGQV
jgi:hypothetical protein